MHQSIHHMQRYVVGAVGLLAAMAATFPVAMARVSSTAKFPGQAINSYNCESRVPVQRQVVAWFDACRPMTVAPLPKAAANPAPTQAPASINTTAQPVAASKPIVSESKPIVNPSSPSLKLGSSGDAVSVLQTQLQSAGAFEGDVDGVFGVETELAVQTLQQKLKVEPNGIADVSFQAAIQTAVPR